MDRAGVLAASACAVHCMLAPLVLAFAPLVGGIWSSPATHWVFAAVSLPAALSLLWRRTRGRSVRLRRWLAGLAFLGSAFVILGLSAPNASWSQRLALEVPCADWMPVPAAAPNDAVDLAGDHAVELAGRLAGGHGDAHACTECCASIHTDESGVNTFRLPFASVVTMLGGLLLVTAHGLAMRAAACCDG